MTKCTGKNSEPKTVVCVNISSSYSLLNQTVSCDDGDKTKLSGSTNAAPNLEAIVKLMGENKQICAHYSSIGWWKKGKRKLMTSVCQALIVHPQPVPNSSLSD